MERLAKRIGTGIAVPKSMQLALERLAAYEDTGMEPDDIKTLQQREDGLAMLLCQVSCNCKVTYTRLRELAEADRAGLCPVLPCKVGDTVWTNFSVAGSYLREKDRPYACRVLFIGLNQSNSGGFINTEYVKSGYQFPLDFDAFGKTAFHTHEAAQKALENEKL